MEPVFALLGMAARPGPVHAEAEHRPAEGVLREGRPALPRQAINALAEAHRLNGNQHPLLKCHATALPDHVLGDEVGGEAGRQ